MPSFADYFSAESIIEELCRARVMLAATRHEVAFFHNIAPDSTPAHAITPDWGSIPVHIFPPRRQWHRFRSKHREGSNAADLNYRALRRAVFELRKEEPHARWAIQLDETVTAIRRRVLSAKPFHFQRPKVIAIKKKPGSHEYRPLALYNLADKIIEGLTARYLRTHLDSSLLKPCLAFRCGSRRQPPPTTHDALSMILETKSRHPGEALYVAECDIKGFFDCVGHAAARQGIEHLIEDTQGNFRPHRRALEIFGAYLESYSFLLSVRGAAQKKLRKRDPKGIFKWHEADLQKLHGRRALPPIGVPQGGALSCLIANAVLHEADKAITAIQEKNEGKLLYLRYCDDMILISPDRAVCVAAFSAYGRALDRLLLPAHPPESVLKYSRAFWDGKSKHPYRWAQSGVPWVQFVGYQVRYDGVVRIRQKSIRKHFDSVTDLTNRLLASIRNADRKRGVRRTSNEILHRFRLKLISMAVGRVTLGRAPRGPMPMSWAAGFRGLDRRTILRDGLKVLDRHRERQIKRVARFLQTVTLLQPQTRSKAVDSHAYYGRPFSYWLQFRRPLRKASRPRPPH